MGADADGPFAGTLARGEAAAAVGGRSWLQAVLDVEAALDPARMRADLGLTGGAPLAERVVLALGGPGAHARVAEAAAGERPFAEALVARPEVRERLVEQRLAALLDPANHLGTGDALVDRALRLHAEAA